MPKHSSQTKYNLIIIGAGPAGLTASLYASRYGVKHIVIGELAGGLAGEAYEVCNFPTEKRILGRELMQKMKSVAENAGAKIILEKVISLQKQGQGFLVKTNANQTYQTDTILFATGTKRRQLGFREEDKYIGRGISYCVTCDGAFFRGKTVAVVGGSNAAVTAALYLNDIAQKVYLIYRKKALRAEKMWLDQLKKAAKVSLILENEITALSGKEKLEEISLKNKYKNSYKLSLDGLFIEIGGVPNTELAKKLGVWFDDQGYILVNQAGATNITGIWAAGDVTAGSNKLQQIITACAEGAIAAQSIYLHLQQVK